MLHARLSDMPAAHRDLLIETYDAFNQMVRHVYEIEDGLIRRIEIRK
jgi:hypothetical protein